MSILLGPFDSSSEAGGGEEDLLMFGYACKLFRDDTKALLESSGQLLIPWMGDHSLMVDRYDVRNRLDDKSQFGIKSNLPYRMSQAERALEAELDQERYLALHCDDLRVEEQEEEERRRASHSSLYSAMGFSYDDEGPEYGPPTKPPTPPPSNKSPEPPEEEYTTPPGLILPVDMETPGTMKLHSIIEKTAAFVGGQGIQMEIILKTKQQGNPQFSFLTRGNSLHPYYTHLKTVISSGAYKPQATPTATPTTNNSINNTCKDSPNKNEKVQSSADEESDSEEDGYLHPLLMTGPRSKSPPPKEPSPPTAVSGDAPVISKPSLTAQSFRAKTMVVNAAPELPKETPSDSNSSAHKNTPGGIAESASLPHAGAPQPPVDYQQPYGVSPAHHMPRPPPPELLAIIDKTAAYVAKNGTQFESTLIQRHLDDPRFNFLNPWDPLYGYYSNQKQHHASIFAQTMPQYPERPSQHYSNYPPSFDQPYSDFPPTVHSEQSGYSHEFNHYSEHSQNNFGSGDMSHDRSGVQKLSYKGAVSFKLQPKSKLFSESGQFESELEPPDNKKQRVESGTQGSRGHMLN